MEEGIKKGKERGREEEREGPWCVRVQRSAMVRQGPRIIQFPENTGDGSVVVGVGDQWIYVCMNR